MSKSISGRFQRSISWAKTHKFYSLFLIIAVFAVGIFAYERIALELNKRAFAQARTARRNRRAGFRKFSFADLTFSLRSLPPLQFCKALLKHDFAKLANKSSISRFVPLPS